MQDRGHVLERQFPEHGLYGRYSLPLRLFHCNSKHISGIVLSWQTSGRKAVCKPSYAILTSNTLGIKVIFALCGGNSLAHTTLFLSMSNVELSFFFSYSAC